MEPALNLEYIIKRRPTMEAQIQTILDQYYDGVVPDIKDLQILDESPDLGILCIRWRDGDRTVTVKSILHDGKLLLTELR
jgi:hypothetical protein